MQTIKSSMYRAGFSHKDVDVLFDQYPRLLMLSWGLKPSTETESHFRKVAFGEIAAETRLEMLWLKFHAHKLYEVARSCEAELGWRDPTTVDAYTTAALAGSTHARQWFARRHEIQGNFWRNTVWNCAYAVSAVYGSSGSYSEP